jgi:hypothetical protein
MMTCPTLSPVPEHAVGRIGRARGLSSWLVALAAAVAITSSGGAAQAANPRETEAAKLFFAGQYPEALKIYVDLAVATGDPSYMCEIGRCYSRMGKPEEASRNLRDCLSQATLTPKKKREFQALQTEVEAARAANAGPPAAAPVPPGAGGAGAPTPPPGWTPAPAAPGAGGYPQGGPPPGYAPAAGQPAQPPSQPLQPGLPGQYPGAPPPTAGGYAQGTNPGQAGAAAGPPPGWTPAPGQAMPPAGAAPAAGAPADNALASGSETRGSDGGGAWMTPVAYVAGSIGVLSAAGGVVAGLMAKSKFDEVGKEYNDAKYKNGKTLNTIQYIGYGLGAVGIGTAITFFLLAPSSSESHAQAGFHLIASPDSIGVGGTF